MSGLVVVSGLGVNGLVVVSGLGVNGLVVVSGLVGLGVSHPTPG